MIDIRKSNINWHDFISETIPESHKKRQKGETAIEWLNRIAIGNSGWLDKFQYRQNNEFWMKDSFMISLAVLSFLRENKMDKETLEDLMGYELDLKGSYDWKLSELKKLELYTNLKLL